MQALIPLGAMAVKAGIDAIEDHMDGDTPPNTRHPSLEMPPRTRRRRNPVQIPENAAGPQPLSPFALARHNMPPPTAEDVLRKIPTFIREAALRKVSEDDARDIRRSMDHSSQSDPGSAGDAPDRATLRRRSALDAVRLQEPMVRSGSDAQTVIPVVPTRMSDDLPEVRAPSVNIYLQGGATSSAQNAPGSDAVPDPESREPQTRGRIPWTVLIAAISTAIATIMGGVAVILAALNRNALNDDEARGNL